MSLDVKDHFLDTHMKDPEHMRVKHKYDPDDSRTKHNTDQLVTNDEWVHEKTQQVMTGLRQASMLAYKHLKLPLNMWLRSCPRNSGNMEM